MCNTNWLVDELQLTLVGQRPLLITRGSNGCVILEESLAAWSLEDLSNVGFLHLLLDTFKIVVVMILL